MKYIRTKCGVYEKDKLYKFYEMLDGKYYKCENYINQNDIIKESDKLEELCDEFVVIDNNGQPQVYSPFDLKTWTTDNDLFGAIWTEKGLIYIAKLNDKGELELL